MKSRLSKGLIIIPALLLFIPAAYGLGFSIGISDGTNGAFDSFNLNAGLDTSLAASIEASPEYYSSTVTSDGPGSLDFDETFTSRDDGEKVRLTASMSDSADHHHEFRIDKVANEQIRASQTLTVLDGKNIDCSAQAWNSLGQSSKVALKIPSGSLTDYSSYGDARDESVEAGQSAIIPKWTIFRITSETQSRNSLQRSGSTLMSSRDLSVGTSSYLDRSGSRSRTTFRLA